MTPRLARLIAATEPGCCLPGGFYHDPEVYHADLAAIWRSGWLFTGHTCEIPNVGDYLTVSVDTDSVIVIRSGPNSFHALHNVCRHRGSQICDDKSGHAGRLVCPYHQWAYGLDGTLLACRGMHDDLDRSTLGLHPVAIEELEGLLFISLATTPMPFAAARAAWAPLLMPQGFRRARVAKAVDYLVHANWKLVWENNRECYHCNQNIH